MHIPAVTKAPRKRIAQHPRLHPCPSAVVVFFKPRPPHLNPSVYQAPAKRLATI